LTLDRFLADLGSKKGAPGGGAAAALTGSIGAALVEMTARLNDARLKKSSGASTKAQTLRKSLRALMAADARAFARIQKIYKVRREKPGAWQKALKGGAKPPLAIARSCAAAANLARGEKSRTSAWLESDRAEALILLQAAFRAAELNVEVNLRLIEDKRFNQLTRLELKRLSRDVR
jgi:formiminotetrahydrofolate cyclodeaminase